EEVDRLQELLRTADADSATTEITGLTPGHPLHPEVRALVAARIADAGPPPDTRYPCSTAGTIYSPSQHVSPRKVHTMAERTVKIASASGLHARPAGIFAQAAAEQPATVTIEKPGGNA